MDTGSADLQFLANRYAAARNKYRPARVAVLFIAEAPPCDLDRYFYFESVSKQDSLFLEITGVLYPEQKAQYLASKRDPFLKAALLERLAEDGYWLLDLAEVPHEVTGIRPEENVPDLLSRVEKAVTPETRIVLIKANVYDCCYRALKERGYQVSSERIPFPGSGQQGVFRQKVRKALEEE